MSNRKYTPQTRLVHQATGHRQPNLGLKSVNPPIYRATTLVYDDFAHVMDWRDRAAKTGHVGYGLAGRIPPWP